MVAWTVLIMILTFVINDKRQQIIDPTIAAIWLIHMKRNEFIDSFFVPPHLTVLWQRWWGWWLGQRRHSDDDCWWSITDQVHSSNDAGGHSDIVQDKITQQFVDHNHLKKELTSTIWEYILGNLSVVVCRVLLIVHCQCESCEAPLFVLSHLDLLILPYISW